MAKSSCASAHPPARPVSATGFLSDGLVTLKGHPAVIQNPDATTEAVLAWCHGEVHALLQLTSALGGVCGEGSITMYELTSLFQHRLEPLERILEAVITELDVTESVAKAVKS